MQYLEHNLAKCATIGYVTHYLDPPSHDSLVSPAFERLPAIPLVSLTVIDKDGPPTPTAPS